MNQSDPYSILADRHKFPGSQRYRRILELLMTPLQAKLVAELPAPPEELAARIGINVEDAVEELGDLFRKGVIIPRDIRTRQGYRFARNVYQLHDSTQSNASMDESLGQSLFDLWEDFCRTEWYPEVAADFSRQEQPVERVVPAYKAIQDISGVLPFEDMRELLKQDPLIAVIPCPCRRQTRGCENEVHTCIQFGKHAEYVLTRGSGRQISYDEALAIVSDAEDAGLVHWWANSQSMNPRVVCLCCSCCCVVWLPLIEHGVSIGKRWAKSRFEATNDVDHCNGCQVCIDRCQFGAIEMVKPPGSKRLKATVDPEKCWGCGLCVVTCAPHSMVLKLVRPPEHVPVQSPPRFWVSG